MRVSFKRYSRISFPYPSQVPRALSAMDLGRYLFNRPGNNDTRNYHIMEISDSNSVNRLITEVFVKQKGFRQLFSAPTRV